MSDVIKPSQVMAALEYVALTSLEDAAPSRRGVGTAERLKILGRNMECRETETRPMCAARILAAEVMKLRAMVEAACGLPKKPAAPSRVGCAACDRGDYQLGHHHECPVIAGRSLKREVSGS